MSWGRVVGRWSTRRAWQASCLTGRRRDAGLGVSLMGVLVGGLLGVRFLDSESLGARGDARLRDGEDVEEDGAAAEKRAFGMAEGVGSA